MKIKIAIGCIVAVFILLMVPSISAVEYNSAVETNRSQILQQLRSMTVNELNEKFEILKEKIKSLGIKETASQTNWLPGYCILILLYIMLGISYYFLGMGLIPYLLEKILFFLLTILGALPDGT